MFVLATEVPHYLEGDVYQPVDREVNGALDEYGSPAKGKRFVGLKTSNERQDEIFGLKASKNCKPFIQLIKCRARCRTGIDQEAGAVT